MKREHGITTRLLPSGYRQLEYLESTTTTYIDTQYYENSQTNILTIRTKVWSDFAYRDTFDIIGNIYNYDNGSKICGINTNGCKIELDFLFYNHSTPTYPNIIDNSSSGNGGIYTQKEGVWKIAITNRAWNVTQTPTFAEQKLNIDVSNFTINNWYHLHIIRIPDLLEVEVTDSNNIQIGYLRNTQVGIFNASLNGSWMKNLTIGGSSAYTPRYLNGCIKNLKIYRHKNY